MKHTITLWHIKSEEEETEVFTFWDLDSDPFSVGMSFYLDFEEHYPAEKTKMLSSGWNEKLLTAFLKDWDIKRNKYKNQLIRLTEKHTSIKLKDNRFKTDYYVEIINPK